MQCHNSRTDPSPLRRRFVPLHLVRVYRRSIRTGFSKLAFGRRSEP